MICRDNGVGVVEDNATRDPMTSLGLRIMDASAQQIAATVDRRSTPDGYVVEMSFKPV
jgi:two-component sensor histidine kinase